MSNCQTFDFNGFLAELSRIESESHANILHRKLMEKKAQIESGQMRCTRAMATLLGKADDILQQYNSAMKDAYGVKEKGINALRNELDQLMTALKMGGAKKKGKPSTAAKKKKTSSKKKTVAKKK